MINLDNNFPIPNAFSLVQPLYEKAYINSKEPRVPINYFVYNELHETYYPINMKENAEYAITMSAFKKYLDAGYIDTMYKYD